MKPYPALLFCFALLTSGCDTANQPRSDAGPPPAVTVVKVEQRLVKNSVEEVARTQAEARVQVRAQVSGIIKARHFDEGGSVRAGDLLYEIDPTQFEADLAVAKAAVATARASQKQAALYLQRLQGMRAGAVAAVDLDAAVSDAAVADANLQQMEAQRRLAELDLERTRIRAPISGNIGQSSIDVGNLVTANGDILTTIVQSDPIEVSWSISDRMLTNIKSATIARNGRFTLDTRLIPRLRLSNGAMYEHPGEILFIDNEVNAGTGTVTIHARFPNPRGLLIPGQFATAVVELNQQQQRLLIPQAAVQQDLQGYFVLVVDADQRVEQRRVELGERSGSDWIVNQGLEHDERIIYLGLEKVRPGIRVQPQLLQTPSPLATDSSRGGPDDVRSKP